MNGNGPHAGVVPRPGSAAAALRRHRRLIERAAAQATGRRRADEGGRHPEFLGHELVGHLANRHDGHRILLDFDFEPSLLRDVLECLKQRQPAHGQSDARAGRRSGTKRCRRAGRRGVSPGQSGNDRFRGGSSSGPGRDCTGAQLQEDVHAPGFGIGIGIEAAAFLPQELHGVGHRRRAELDVRDDDALELAGQKGGAFRIVNLADVLLGVGVQPLLANGQIPALVDLLEQVAARMVVAHRIVVLGPGEVDALLPLAGGVIVRIDREDLLVTPVGEVVTRAVVETLRLDEELLDLVDLVDQTRGHRVVEILRILEVFEQLDGRLVARVVLGTQDDLDRGLGVDVAALGDALVGEHHRGVEELGDGLGAAFSGGGRRRQSVDGGAVLARGQIVILADHRRVTRADVSGRTGGLARVAGTGALHGGLDVLRAGRGKQAGKQRAGKGGPKKGRRRTETDHKEITRTGRSNEGESTTVGTGDKPAPRSRTVCNANHPWASTVKTLF